MPIYNKMDDYIIVPKSTHFEVLKLHNVDLLAVLFESCT